MKIKESDIRKQIQEYLRWNKWFVYYNLAGLGSYPGLSDLVAIRGGRIVHIEVKRPRGVQSSPQKEFQADLEAAGGEYIIARGIEDVKHLVEKRLRLRETEKAHSSCV